MRTRKRKKDCFPRVILAAFLFLSASHMFCRFDVSTQLESLCTKAWAEVMPQQLAEPGQPAAGSVNQSSTTVTFTTATIARNPFIAPTVITEKPAPASAPSSAAAPSGQGGGGAAAAAAAPAPVAEPEPILTGIVNKGNNHVAIISYNGSSGFYRVGQSFSGYYVSDISSNSVALVRDGDTTDLTLGR